MEKKINERAKRIKVLILDVDGVLTNGNLYYPNEDTEVKAFNIYDGLGIQLLQKTGVIVAIISGKTSAGLLRRLQELNIQHFYLSYADKKTAYEDLKQKLKIVDNEIAYVGDDLPDLPLLIRAGLAITVKQAPEIMHKHAHYVTTKKGGKGAVREICELIMQAQGHFESMLQSYTS